MRLRRIPRQPVHIFLMINLRENAISG